jgi:hypothetical protein
MIELYFTVLVLEGIAIAVLKNEKMRNRHIVEQWMRGNFQYEELLALKKYGYIHVRKINKSVKIGKNPGQSKKND